MKSFVVGNQLDIGLLVTVKSTRAAYSPATLTCTVTQPDKTTATPAVTPNATGDYSILFTPTQTGVHTADIVGKDGSANIILTAQTEFNIESLV